MEGEEGEGGLGTGDCPLQEGLAAAVVVSVLVEGAGVAGRCSASAGAAAGSRVTGLNRTWGEEGEVVEGGEQRRLDSEQCGVQAATTTATQRGTGT